jgi:hypothetical protein
MKRKERKGKRRSSFPFYKTIMAYKKIRTMNVHLKVFCWGGKFQMKDSFTFRVTTRELFS